jgi:hypothetical protein
MDGNSLEATILALGSVGFIIGTAYFLCEYPTKAIDNYLERQNSVDQVEVVTIEPILVRKKEDHLMKFPNYIGHTWKKLEKQGFFRGPWHNDEIYGRKFEVVSDEKAQGFYSPMDKSGREAAKHGFYKLAENNTLKKPILERLFSF